MFDMNPISSIRARLGVTQSAMAEALGVTQGNVSNYERGQTVPPDVARLLIVYAASLGVHITFNDVYSTSEPSEQAGAAPDPDPPPSRKNLLECGTFQPKLYERAR